MQHTSFNYTILKEVKKYYLNQKLQPKAVQLD